jgi:hydroxymethylbilane synthase
VYARLQGEVVTTACRVLAQDGTEAVTGARDLPVERHAEAAAGFAADLADRGAKRLVEQARRDQPDDAKREQ